MCSWCGKMITKDILRTWRGKKEARFHGKCFIEVYKRELIF